MELKGSGKRGGARAGAGRRPTAKFYSDDFKAKLKRAARAKEKATGRSVFDEFMAMIYDPGTHPNAKVGLFKCYFDAFAVRESRQTVERIERGPVISLPAIMEVPPEYRTKDHGIQ